MMKKFVLLLEPGACFIALTLLLISCSGNDATQTKPATPDSTKMVTIADGKTDKLLSGNLDTLWIQAPVFLPLNPRISFRFYDTANTFTLHGWLGANNSYNNRPPDVRLIIGRKSTVQFGPGSYFGNLMLTVRNLNVIQRLITQTNARFVLFAPQDPAANNGQVIYKIFLTNDDPDKATLLTVNLIPTGEFTNPSPPRNE